MGVELGVGVGVQVDGEVGGDETIAVGVIVTVVFRDRKVGARSGNVELITEQTSIVPSTRTVPMNASSFFICPTR